MRRVDFRVSYQPRIQHATHQQSASRRALGGNTTLRRPTGADQVLCAGNEVAKCVLLLQQLALSFVPVTAHLAATCRGRRQVLYVSNGDAFSRTRGSGWSTQMHDACRCEVAGTQKHYSVHSTIQRIVWRA